MRKLTAKRDLQLKKIVTMMRLLYMTQVLVVIGVALYMGMIYLIDGEIPAVQLIVTIIVIMTLIIIFNGYFIFRDTTIFRQLTNQIEIKDEAYKNIEALNLKLRAQRHDFLNHIQILYSLMELEAYDETSSYLNELYGDVGKVNANIKTASVPMNALLQAKANEAEVRGIPYSTDINSRLEEMNMPDWELCRVVGNMIDNGLRASETMESDGYVAVVIHETIVNYQITIKNSSPPIEPHRIEQFFEAGITTKKDKSNHGMGLYISREIVNKYDNTIEMVYEEGEVKVTVTVLKSVNQPLK